MAPCLAVEHASDALEAVEGDAGDLHDGALRRQRALQHGDAADGVDRGPRAMDDGAVGLGRVDVGEVLGDRPSRHGEGVAVQQAGVEEVLAAPWARRRRRRSPTCGTSRRAHVGDVRHLRRDAVEVVELELDPRLVGDGEQVQHRVRRAAERHRDGDGVLERLLREDLAGPDAQLEEPHDRLARRRRRCRRGARSTADGDAEPGSDMPMASAIVDIVLAVNMPAQLPSVGQALRSMASSSASSIVPAAWAPTASKTLTMSRALPLWLPGRIEPP